MFWTIHKTFQLKNETILVIAIPYPSERKCFVRVTKIFSLLNKTMKLKGIHYSQYSLDAKGLNCFFSVECGSHSIQIGICLFDCRWPANMSLR